MFTGSCDGRAIWRKLAKAKCSVQTSLAPYIFTLASGLEFRPATPVLKSVEQDSAGGTSNYKKKQQREEEDPKKKNGVLLLSLSTAPSEKPREMLAMSLLSAQTCPSLFSGTTVAHNSARPSPAAKFLEPSTSHATMGRRDEEHKKDDNTSIVLMTIEKGPHGVSENVIINGIGSGSEVDEEDPFVFEVEPPPTDSNDTSQNGGDPSFSTLSQEDKGEENEEKGEKKKHFT